MKSSAFIVCLATTLLPLASNGFVVQQKKGVVSTRLSVATTTAPSLDTATTPADPHVVNEQNPLKVVIAGAGVGGLVLANALQKYPHIQVSLLEKTDQFKRFGGPIQLASNALKLVEEMDPVVYDEIMKRFTFTGDKMNGIKDGIRNEWYSKFDLASPAEARGMPYTGVIDRPDLQEIYLQSLPDHVVQNGDGVVGYTTTTTKTTSLLADNDDNEHDASNLQQQQQQQQKLSVQLKSGATVDGVDVLIGADGIWSAVRATMRNEPVRGEGSGVSYSGYTVFAGELAYDSFDNGEVGYKVYIGPNQYFVITDIGKGNYQWYAFLARPPGSAETEAKPDGSSPFLQQVFAGWSADIHHILKATKEDEIEQRDLYDRPPSVMKPWTDGPVALLGDAVHAMMPNLGQGGCQAMEDAFVLQQELSSITDRRQVSSKLDNYKNRRLIRSAAVQGLSRFASDIIIRGFDTPAKIVWQSAEQDGEEGAVSVALPRFENFNYAGIVTKMLQPILPLFFSIQFNFLYEGWRNESQIDVRAAFGFLLVGGLILLLGAGAVGDIGGLGLGLGLESVFGTEGLEALIAGLREFMEGFGF